MRWWIEDEVRVEENIDALVIFVKYAVRREECLASASASEALVRLRRIYAGSEPGRVIANHRRDEGQDGRKRGEKKLGGSLGGENSWRAGIARLRQLNSETETNSGLAGRGCGNAVRWPHPHGKLALYTTHSDQIQIRTRLESESGSGSGWRAPRCCHWLYMDTCARGRRREAGNEEIGARCRSIFGLAIRTRREEVRASLKREADGISISARLGWGRRERHREEAGREWGRNQKYLSVLVGEWEEKESLGL
ncbi:hypothetical protein B0H19DRAFT_1078771 [Mycena capillaripes]|nr:hypothetical protein B0H19DRAFT_1078771 [Mycena capillaripes]